MQLSICDQILDFYSTLQGPAGLSSDVHVMNPYPKDEVFPLVKQFYRKYYPDYAPRVALFGINPGRFGAGITGVPFTDPIHLEADCNIANGFEKKLELSSNFIYEMIAEFGGPESFYARYFITAVSPLGYTQKGKNLNYYDLPGWRSVFTGYITKCIQSQLPFLTREKAFCIGQGTNMKFLQELNNQRGFFGEIISLPHPRWVMQYQLKRKDIYIKEYLDKLL